MKLWLFSLTFSILASNAHADAAAYLRDFVKKTRNGRAEFTQTVIQPDGTRGKPSTGEFEFVRPGQFRFTYANPHPQLIIADGNRVWLHDIELNQVVVRSQAESLMSTPAAILAGSDIDKNYTLRNETATDGIEWVLTTPRAAITQPEMQFERIKVGFKDKNLAALEITDSLGQRTLLLFTQVRLNIPLVPKRFQFQVPAGADVIEQ
jgi:outer membrane lipoprotein carrier protein